MSRPLRIELAGGLYHVTSRGDRREDIFFADDDRVFWLALLGDVCQRFNWVCHAYCQMTNHWHIVIETPEGNLSQGMRQLNGVYTQYINRTHKRVGHVYQGRYKAILVERDSYLLELARYVVLNPVRAQMVADAGAWPWSSFGAMMGNASAPEWLETRWLLRQFSESIDQARAAYAAFVRNGHTLDSPWTKLKGQIYLGSETFVNEVQAQLVSNQAADEIPRAQRRPIAAPLSAYLTDYADRHEGMARAYLSGDYSMKDIATVFDVHYATVSRAVKRLERELARL